MPEGAAPDGVENIENGFPVVSPCPVQVSVWKSVPESVTDAASKLSRMVCPWTGAAVPTESEMA